MTNNLMCVDMIAWHALMMITRCTHENGRHCDARTFHRALNGDGDGGGGGEVKSAESKDATVNGNEQIFNRQYEKHNKYTGSMEVRSTYTYSNKYIYNVNITAINWDAVYLSVLIPHASSTNSRVRCVRRPTNKYGNGNGARFDFILRRAEQHFGWSFLDILRRVVERQRDRREREREECRSQGLR